MTNYYDNSEGLESAELDERFKDAEKRITIASYYKQLVKGGIFNDGTEEAAIIDAEIREFAHKRMTALLGMDENTESNQALGFTDIEISTLKQIANRAIERQTQPNANPVLKPIQSPIFKAKESFKPLNKPVPTVTPQFAEIPFATPIAQAVPVQQAKPSKPKPYKEVTKEKKPGKAKKISKTPQVPHTETVSNIRATPTSLPMPTGAQYEQIMATQAMTSSIEFGTAASNLSGGKKPGE